MIKSLWSDEEAAHYAGGLGLRVYTSRLLGRDQSLVLHGGGNTSVKLRETNLLGEEEDILYVKGSGWDLETITEAGFAPVRMAHLLKLAQLATLPDPHMVNELLTHMTRASAPAPSIETILHAILPYQYVDHTHADAVVTVSNSVDGAQRIREIYGNDVVVVPYVMPGFDLARLCAVKFAQQSHPGTLGMVLLNHGIFSFGASAKEAYESMIALVARAERYLAEHQAWEVAIPATQPISRPLPHAIAQLRHDISQSAGCAMLLATHGDARSLAFCRRPDLAEIAQQGPATPDHVIRTKRLPLIGRDVAAYAAAYRRYFGGNSLQAQDTKIMLDPAPRVVLDAEFGLCTAGRSAKDAAIVADIYRHTMDIIARATQLGGYRALAARELFEVEYWDLEQAKLKKSGKPPLFAGEVALVTGAASGIGKACVETLLARGAAVIALDLNPAVTALYSRPDFLGIACDLTDCAALAEALETGVKRYGGLDMLLLNAGVFPASRKIEVLSDADWRHTMHINLDANLALLRGCHPLLKLAPNGGRVVVIGSKNVPAPGPGAAAYSASKAALTQLARVAALEWGQDGIRINVLHPNMVFDTGIWSDEVLAARAAHYGLSVAEYKTNNVLQTEVSSRDVAELAAEMCGPLFAKTTGAQLAVDGGNDRVI